MRTARILVLGLVLGGASGCVTYLVHGGSAGCKQKCTSVGMLALLPARPAPESRGDAPVRCVCYQPDDGFDMLASQAAANAAMQSMMTTDTGPSPASFVSPLGPAN